MSQMALKKYPKVRRPTHPDTDGLFAHPEHELVITEKFDGNNFRFGYDDGELRFGSRNVDLGTDVDEIGGMFDDVSDYIADTVDPNWLAILEDAYDAPVTVFGENAVEHTIEDYQWEEIPQFQVFDVFVRCDDGRQWLPWDDVEHIAERLDLETVPVVERTTVEEFDVEEFEVPASTYRPDGGVAEGVVIRNTVNAVKAKVISEEFAEKHESAKSNEDSFTKASGDIGKFLANHVTARRIEKNVETLIDSPEHDYEAPVMEMMPDLAPAVWEDAWEEDWHDIIYEDYELDIGECRSKTSSKTAKVLRKIMKEQPVVDPGTGEVIGSASDGGEEA